MLKRFFSGLSMWQWLLLGLSTVFGIFLLTRNSRKGAQVTTIPLDAPGMLVFHLLNFLITHGYDEKLRPWIMALSAMESGRWTSPLWEIYNNPWGMRNPEERETTSVGSTPNYFDVPEGFAIYLSSSTAAQDFVFYLNARNCPKTFNRFYDFIEFIQSKGYEPNLSTMEYFSRCLNAIK